MEWSGARSLYWRSLTAGAATWSSLYCLYKGCVHQNNQIPKRPRALCPGGLYSWWHFASPANESGSRDCAPVTWAYGTPCPAMVSPNVGPSKEGKLLYPDHHLIRCTKSGFRPAQGENYISPKRKLFLMEKCSRQQPYWMEVMLDYLSP